MGKKTKTQGGGGGRKVKFWCYYCGADSKDEGTLVQHQAAKHFACPFCDVGAFGRLCQSLSGLISHVRRSHRKELETVPGAMSGRESTETDVYGMSGIPAAVLEAARQNEPDDDDDDAPAPPQRQQQQQQQQPPQQQRQQQQEPSGNVDSITQALAGAASDSTSPMAKALLAAVATNSPATAGDTDNIIKAVLRAATTPKDQQGRSMPQMSMPSMPPPGMGGCSGQPSAGMMGIGGLLGQQNMAKASAMTGLLGQQNNSAMVLAKPADSGYSSLGLPQPPRSFGGSSMAMSLPEARPMSLGMGSGQELATSNKEDKPPPFPTRAEFRRACQEEELKAELGKFRPGATIEIKALVNNAKLNGAQGKVVSIMTDIMGTVKVQLADSGKQYCIRPANMRITDTSTEHLGGDTADKRKNSRSRSRGGRKKSESPKKRRRTRWDTETPAERMKQQLAMEPVDLTRVKPSMCMTFTEGLCTKGDACAGAHSIRELAPGGFKPKLCPSYNGGTCPRGDVCVYAHDPKELPPNFKLSLCANFQGGHCRKQGICNFAHGHDELKFYQELLAPVGLPALGMPGSMPALTMGGAMGAPGGVTGPLGMGGAVQPLGFLGKQFAAAKAGVGQPCALMNSSFPPPGGMPGQPAMLGGLVSHGASWGGGAQAKSTSGFPAPPSGCGGFPGGGGCGGFPGGGGFPPPPMQNMGAGSAKMPGLFPPAGGAMSKMPGVGVVGMSKANPGMGMTAPPAAREKCMLWEMGGCSLGKACPLEHVPINR